MFRFLILTAIAFSGLCWAADIAPTDSAKSVQPNEPPAQVLPTGGLIFSVRPEGSTVQVNRISAPAMSPWMVGQELMTGADQYAHVLLADRTVMTLGPNSNVVLQQTPVLRTGGNDTTVQLRQGSLQVVTSKTAVENGFRVNTPLGDAVAVGTNYNVEVSSKGEMIGVLVRVKLGEVNFLMNGQTFAIKESEKRLFSQPSRAEPPTMLADTDVDAMLDLLVSSAEKVTDEELFRILEQRVVSVNVRVRSGKVVFRMKGLDYPVQTGKKRIFDQPSDARDPLDMTDADFSVMMDLFKALAEKVSNEELGWKPGDQILPTGAIIFSIRPEGDKVTVDGAPVSQMSKWNVGQELATGPGQYAHLLLSDRTVMTLGPDSNALLEQRPVAATGANETTVQLRKGSIQVLTSKVATKNGFRVSTPLGDAVALGTDYHVEIKFVSPLVPRVVPTETPGNPIGGNIIPTPLSP